MSPQTVPPAARSTQSERDLPSRQTVELPNDRPGPKREVQVHRQKGGDRTKVGHRPQTQDHPTAASLLLAYLPIVLAVRKLPQDEHEHDDGDTDADDDDEFCSHDLSYRRTGRPP